MEVKGVMLRLEDHRSKASSAEKKIIEVLVNDPEMVIGKSIHELSKLTYASPSTIVRLCKKLGFTGYRDFQQALVYEAAFTRDSREVLKQEIPSTATTEDIIRQVTKRNTEALQISEKLIEPDVIDHCVDLIDRCHMVYFFGIGASLLVARDFCLKLMRVEKPCSANDDLHSQLLTARIIQPDDLGIVISYSGVTTEMVDCAEDIKKRGAGLVVITRAVTSRMAELADCLLPVASSEPLVRSGATSSRISQLNVVDIVYSAYVNRHYDEFMKLLPTTFLGKDVEQGMRR